jgi:metal-responsive CopG/Arc/MetJ family transcriptional regulator/predicted RNase H-like HicB family nuclease
MPAYVAVIARKNGNHVATFPDFPELRAEGATMEDVRVEAQGALEEHLAMTFEKDKPLVARSLDEIAPQTPAGAVLMAITVSAPKSRAVRINITVPEDLLQAIDRSATAHSMTRSRFLAKAAESVVTGRRHGGIQIPMSDELLAAVDKAAEAHEMNRTTFLTRVIEVGLGLREGHHKERGSHHAKK